MRLLCYMSAQSKPHEFENPFSLRQSAVSRTGLRDLPPGNLDHHSIAAKRGFRERATRSVCCWGTTHIITIGLLLLDRPDRTCVGLARRDGHANRCHNLAGGDGDGSQAYSSRVTVLEFNIVVGIIGVVLAGWPCRFPSYVSRLTICVEGLLNLRQAKCPSLAFAAPGRRRWATG